MGAGFGVGHFETGEGVEDNPGNNQPGVVFVIGRHHIPGGLAGTGGSQTFLIGLPILFPEFPLLDVRQAEFPVLLRLVNAGQKALSLLVLREVQVELDDPGSIAVEMSLQILDRTDA